MRPRRARGGLEDVSPLGLRLRRLAAAEQCVAAEGDDESHDVPSPGNGPASSSVRASARAGAPPRSAGGSPTAARPPTAARRSPRRPPPRRAWPAGSGGRSPRASASAISSSVTWYGASTRAARLSLGLLAHRRPDVGVDGVGAGDRRARVVDDGQLALRSARPARAPARARSGSGSYSAGQAIGDVEPGKRRGFEQRVRDVVAAVADEGEPPPGELAEDLGDRRAGRRAPGRGGARRRAR